MDWLMALLVLRLCEDNMPRLLLVVWPCIPPGRRLAGPVD